MLEFMLAEEAQPETIETTGQVEEASGIDTILPATAELVYGAISFLIVFAVLQKFAFPRLHTMLDERRAAIMGKMEDADKALDAAKATQASFEARIADARGEASAIIEQAKADAEALRRDIIEKAEAEAQSVKSRAATEAASERDRAIHELRGQVGSLSVQLASKIVERELDASTHQHLVDEYIARLSSAN